MPLVWTMGQFDPKQNDKCKTSPEPWSEPNSTTLVRPKEVVWVQNKLNHCLCPACRNVFEKVGPSPSQKQCRLTLSKTKLAREAHKNARTFQLFSERMKERGSRSTQTCKPCTWWWYQVGMSVEVCSHNYSVKPKRSNVSKPNHWSRLTGVKPQLNECISCCFCHLVKIQPMSCKGMLEVARSTTELAPMHAALKRLNICSSMTTADGEKLLDHLLLFLFSFFSPLKTLIVNFTNTWPRLTGGPRAQAGDVKRYIW